jgi:hypothetical protein
VLQRLDRLTQEEGRTTLAQTFGVVHGLVKNVKVVMNGTRACLLGLRRVSDIVLIDGKVSAGGMREALSMFYRVRKSGLLELTMMADTMQQMASNINKMRRSLSIR